MHAAARGLLGAAECGRDLFQGMMRQEEKQETLVLVRLNLDETTIQHLRDSNCLTPRATACGLWTFDASELS